MEFKFRAVDHPSPPPQTPTSFPNTAAYFSHSSLPGGFPGMVPSSRHSSFGMPMGNANQALWREMEKEQIRREIIAGEMQRRRELEEEVRRELAAERGWGMTMAATSHGLSFDQRVSAMHLTPSPYLFDNNAQPQLQHPQLVPPAEFKPSTATKNNEVIKLDPVKIPSPSACRVDTNAFPQSQLPQLMAPAEEFKPYLETDNDKVVKPSSLNFSSPFRYQFDNNAWPQPQLYQLMAPVEEFKSPLETNSDKVVNLSSVKLPSPGRYQFDAWPLPQLPELLAPDESKPSPETGNDKVMKLAKPDPNHYDAKRKAVTPPDVDESDHISTGLKIKSKEEWICEVCKVSATSEKGLNDHLQGKKHKAKEKGLRKKFVKSTSTSSKESEKSVKSKTNMPSLEPSFIPLADITETMAKKIAMGSKYEEQSMKNENGTENVEEGMNPLKRKRMKFWCETCQVGTFSQVVMESHKKGKKHLARVNTSSVSVEAPVLIKDTDAGNKEVMIKMENNFANSN